MNKSRTIYSKIVFFKKRFIKKTLVPKKIGYVIDNFFNNLHNISIISIDLIRDFLIKFKDVTRDNVVQFKDVTRDNVVRFKRLKRLQTNIENILYTYIALFIFFIKSFFELLYVIFTHKSIKINDDTNAMKEIDTIVVNSKNVQNRVSKFYNKESCVLYPPIPVNKFYFSKDASISGDYWLSVNRITPEKRVELQINVFNKLKQKLIIVGGSDDLTYYEKIKNLAGPNILFLKSVNEVYLRKLYSEAMGFITTAKDEDFGMTAVEAMASGKPVIAPNEGGYKESVVHNLTGLLIDEIDESKLSDAVQKIDREIKNDPNKYKRACQDQARKFDISIFIEEVTNKLNVLFEQKKSFKKEKIAVAVFSFNRPKYLKQVLYSIEQNTDLKDLDFYLFQDGAVNKFSGRIAAKDSDIKKCINVWDECTLPNKRIIQNHFNLSIAATQFNAKVRLFEDYGYEQVMFFEDDMILSKNYIRLLKIMLKQFKEDKNVSRVSCSDSHRVQRTKMENKKILQKLETGNHHLWGWATWKDRWELIKPDFLDYYKLVSNIDYKKRENKKILELFLKKDCTISGSSQDAGMQYAFSVNNLIELQTCVSRAKYIGEKGEHMNLTLFKEEGYDVKNEYDFKEDSVLEKFDEYDKEAFKKQVRRALFVNK